MQFKWVYTKTGLSGRTPHNWQCWQCKTVAYSYLSASRSKTQLCGELLSLQAAEQGHYDVAELLVTAKSDLVNAKDKRDLLALDLVKTLDDDKWSTLLKNCQTNCKLILYSVHYISCGDLQVHLNHKTQIAVLCCPLSMINFFMLLTHVYT